MSWFKRKVILSEDFVDLSIGRVYYKPFLNHNIRKAENLSGDNFNLFYTILEVDTLDLSLREYENLSIENGNKVRSKTKEILIRYGIGKSEEVKVVNEGWSTSDKKWFEEQQNLAAGKIQKSFRRMNDGT